MRWWMGALLLAGCNAVLGLEETIARGPDFDNDGTDTATDNCPTVANPDQADVDGDRVGDACDPCPEGIEALTDDDADGIDDACDPCPLGPQHDDDADGIMDACDVCPAIADAAQLDEDADGVGDACESASGLHHRRFFEGFVEISREWLSIHRWAAVNDAAAPVEPATSVSNRELWNPARALAAHGTIEVRINLPVMPAAANVELQLLTGGYGPIGVCALQWNGTEWAIRALLSGTIVLPGLERPRLRMTYTHTPGMGSAFSCEVVGMSQSVVSGMSAATSQSGLFVGLETQTATFDYVETIDLP